MGLRARAKEVKIIDDDNIYLSDAQKGLALCSNIISLGEVSFKEALIEIDAVLDAFMQLSQNDTNKMGVKVYKELQALKEDIINIVSFPQLENNYTVAVGGSFSSGKSTFLNRVLGLEDVLPTDTNPTTSISSYITKGDKESFVALNNFNNIIELDKEAIQAISHAFYKKYNVSFSHILKLISIEQPKLKYDNLVFLDTPGYSKSDDIDENVAREHLRTTDFLIWLVDSQTSIPSSDIHFIKSLELEHPILVVLNKADKRTPKDIEALVQKTQESLEEHSIAFYDVVGYSSSEGIESSTSQNVIESYLTTIASSTRGTKILKQIEDIFKLYTDYYDSQLVEYRATRGVLNEMIMKEAVLGTYADTIQTLSSKRIKQIKHIEEAKKSIDTQRTKLLEVVESLLQQYSITNITYKKQHLFDKTLYNGKKAHSKTRKSFRFNGSIQLKDEKELLKYKDLDAIEGIIYKVSSIGVFIKIAGLSGDIMVSKSNILKEDSIVNIKEVFKVDEKVLVQILKHKKCVVIK